MTSKPTRLPSIATHLWYDKDALQAAELYTSLFPGSKITSQSIIKDTPSGDCDVLSFNLTGTSFMAISAGPVFKFNPSISLFASFESESEIKRVWDKLIVGGQALMPYDTYPWAHKYGWLQDNFGLSWQLSWGDNPTDQKITPLLMYTQKMSGKTKEAIDYYTSIFPGSSVDSIVPYAKGEGDTEGFTKHSRFKLAGTSFMAMDSSGPHQFVFNEAVSLVVTCETQDEIDYYWDKLSAVPESEQCGWLKDKYGVSWQIVPTALGRLMGGGDSGATQRVTAAFLQMKKFDLNKLEEAFKG